MDAHPLRNFCAGQLRHAHVAVVPVVCAPTPPLDHLGVAAVATGFDVVYILSTDSLGR